VLHRLPGGQLKPLSGVTLTVRSGGQVIDTVTTDHQGIYRAQLRRNHHNAIRPAMNGFTFDPEVVLATPSQREVLGDMIATPVGGAGGVLNPPPDLGQGRVIIQLSGDPAVNPLHFAKITVRDARTNRVIREVRTGGLATVSFQEDVGRELLLTPSAQINLRWTPNPARVRVTPANQTVRFTWEWPDPGKVDD